MNSSNTQSLNYSKFTHRKKNTEYPHNEIKHNLKLQQIPGTLIDTAGSTKVLQHLNPKFLRYIAYIILTQATFSTCCNYMM